MQGIPRPLPYSARTADRPEHMVTSAIRDRHLRRRSKNISAGFLERVIKKVFVYILMVFLPLFLSIGIFVGVHRSLFFGHDGVRQEIILTLNLSLSRYKVHHFHRGKGIIPYPENRRGERLERDGTPPSSGTPVVTS